MALNKEIVNGSGVTTTYHRIDHVSITDNQMHCSVLSYVSSFYRDLDKAVDSSVYTFDISLEEEESMGIRQLCYSKLKELEFWSDATDC